MSNISENKKRIYGIYYEEIISDGYIIWRPEINNPFKEADGYWKIGLNRKFLTTARIRGVSYFLLTVGQREIKMSVPDEKTLKQKDKDKEYEDKPSIFKGSPPIRIYYFTLADL